MYLLSRVIHVVTFKPFLHEALHAFADSAAARTAPAAAATVPATCAVEATDTPAGLGGGVWAGGGQHQVGGEANACGRNDLKQAGSEGVVEGDGEGERVAVEVARLQLRCQEGQERADASVCVSLEDEGRGRQRRVPTQPQAAPTVCEERVDERTGGANQRDGSAAVGCLPHSSPWWVEES